MKNTRLFAVILILAGCSSSYSSSSDGTEPEVPPVSEDRQAADPAGDESGESVRSHEVATLGAGCFWCVEAVYEQLDGVLDVSSGYMGGHVEDPDYRAVCSGSTGHAEVVQVSFDPGRISYGDVLNWFWRLHDPTTKDRQGGDVGPQYRSVIFYHDEQQREIAGQSMKEANSSGAFLRPIVTEIVPAEVYYEAEDDHQDYYRGNKRQTYCQRVIQPKLDKLGLQD